MKRFQVLNVLLLLVILSTACSESPNGDRYDPSRFPSNGDNTVALSRLSDEQRQTIWADTITPPNNPFAPPAQEVQDSIVTIHGTLTMERLWFGNREFYCSVRTKNAMYFLASHVSSSASETNRFVLWHFAAEQLQPFCVGDSLLVEGWPYSLSEYYDDGGTIVLDVETINRWDD